MSAYDTPQREQPARLLQLETRLPQAAPVSSPDGSVRTQLKAPCGTARLGLDERSVMDVLLDGLADRIAAAVIARIGRNVGDQHDEWLDSGQAAKYLGLHRDTLRRLAAARAIPSEQDGPGCKLFFRRTELDEWRRSGGSARRLAAVPDAA
jgi:excisionase family DNA binding protein